MPHDYPATQISVIEALSSADDSRRRAAAELVARVYWAPVVSTLRLRWKLEPADAEDLAQDFFGEAFARDWLARYDRDRARFRSFLRMCVDRYAAKALESRSRLKRGGGAETLSLDPDVAVATDPAVDEQFRREWIRAVFTLALEKLRAEATAAGKDVHVALFEAYDVDDPPDDQRPSYRELAARHGLPETSVTNHLAWARRAFRAHVLDVLRSLAGSEAEFRDDARELLGIRP